MLKDVALEGLSPSPERQCHLVKRSDCGLVICIRSMLAVKLFVDPLSFVGPTWAYRERMSTKIFYQLFDHL